MDEIQEAQEAEVAEPQEIDAQDSEQETQEQAAVQKPSTEAQERNWRALEKKREEAERRAQQLEKQNAEYIAMIKEFIPRKEHTPEPEEDDSYIPNLGDTKKTARKEAETVSEKVIRRILEEERQKNAPKLLKEKFADFDDIVSTENVNYLIENEPELAESLKNTTDLYHKGVAAYKIIKNLGIAKNDSVNDMKQDSSKNTAKPVSPNAIAGRNSVGDANVFSRRLTPELKKQLQKEMSEAIKRR